MDLGGIEQIPALLAGDPTAFMRMFLGLAPTADQEKALRGVRDNQRTLLLGGNTTGKTKVASSIALEWLLPREGEGVDSSAGVLIVSANWTQLIDTLWATVRLDFKRSADRGLPLAPATCLLWDRLKIADDRYLRCVSTKDENAFQGRHPSRLLVIFDECLFIEPGMWSSASGMMANERCRFLAITNPLHPEGEAFRVSKDPKRWSVVNFSALNHPNVIEGREVIPNAVTRQWVDEMRDKYGEDHPEWYSRVLGEFPPGGSDRIIPLHLLEASATFTPTDFDGTHVGVDVALGGDACVAVTVTDRKLVRLRKWRSRSASETVQRIKDIQADEGCPWENVHVDATAMGAALVSFLKGDNCDADGVHLGDNKFASAWRETVGKVRCRNTRAYLYWVCRRLLEDKQLCIPADTDFDELRRDLSEPSYSPGLMGITVEDKDAVRRRLGRSPDAGDALVLSLSRRYAHALPVAFFA